MQTHREMIEAIEADERGEPMQVCSLGGADNWLDTDKLTFNFALKKYRSKPMEVWINEYPNGLHLYAYPAPRVADVNAEPNRIRRVLFREVLPGDE